MLKYYQSVIEKTYKDFRNALLAAICHLLGMGKEISGELKAGNETLTDISPVFNDRGMVLTKETVLSFTVTEDGLEKETNIPLEDASLEWLQAIYEKLSGNQIK